jgi:uncharacterized Zn-finger protein
MLKGTLAEKRTSNTPTTTTEAPTVVIAPEVKPIILKVVEEQPPIKEPTLILEVPKTPKEEQKAKCTYCKVDRIITLSIRGSVTLVLLAICFHLIKSAK